MQKLKQNFSLILSNKGTKVNVSDWFGLQKDKLRKTLLVQQWGVDK